MAGWVCPKRSVYQAEDQGAARLIAADISLVHVERQFCHQGSWQSRGDRKRGVCERARMRVHAVSLQQFHQFIRLVQTSISTRLDHSIRSYILLQRHCYIESPLRSLLEAANQPDAAPVGSLL